MSFHLVGCKFLGENEAGNNPGFQRDIPVNQRDVPGITGNATCMIFFDPKNVKFVISSILCDIAGLRQAQDERLPHCLEGMACAHEAFAEILEGMAEELGRRPTVKEIQEATGLNASEAKEILKECLPPQRKAKKQKKDKSTDTPAEAPAPQPVPVEEGEGDFPEDDGPMDETMPLEELEDAEEEVPPTVPSDGFGSGDDEGEELVEPAARLVPVENQLGLEDELLEPSAATPHYSAGDKAVPAPTAALTTGRPAWSL